MKPLIMPSFSRGSMIGSADPLLIGLPANQVMKIKKISAGANGEHNEDLIAVYETGGFTDIVIMDGGTSVADRDFIDSDIGDVVWFARSFSSALAKTISPDRSQGESVSLAINDVHALFRAKTSTVSVPLYAYPIAAMTWIRITETENAVTLKIYCLGDCKTFLLLADNSVVDLDPYINPQESILKAEIIRLSEEGVIDGAARKERLMPMLRARREFLNTSGARTVLCLAPDGPFGAREHSMQVEPGCMLLAMTDGFYRLVDTYDLHTIESLANLCLKSDLESIVKELRDFEMASLGSASLSVKSSDDASAVTWLSSRARR
jgi:hypothetical protein